MPDSDNCKGGSSMLRLYCENDTVQLTITYTVKLGWFKIQGTKKKSITKNVYNSK
jgi:hypothetical protein